MIKIKWVKLERDKDSWEFKDENNSLYVSLYKSGQAFYSIERNEKKITGISESKDEAFKICEKILKENEKEFIKKVLEELKKENLRVRKEIQEIAKKIGEIEPEYLEISDYLKGFHDGEQKAKNEMISFLEKK